MTTTATHTAQKHDTIGYALARPWDDMPAAAIAEQLLHLVTADSGALSGERVLALHVRSDSDGSRQAAWLDVESMAMWCGYMPGDGDAWTVESLARPASPAEGIRTLANLLAMWRAAGLALVDMSFGVQDEDAEQV